jgi:hypothetical protein
MAYIGRQNLGGAYRQLDDISSGFDGSDTTHTMQVNSTNVTVGDVNQILLSLGGVIQKPGTDFTVSGSTLTFTTAPAANTSFFAILLGSDNGGTVTPTDASVTTAKIVDANVTKAKLADSVDIFAGTSLSAADLGSGIHIKSADSGASVSSDADELILENSRAGMSFLSSADNYGIINFGDSGDNNIGQILYYHGDNSLSFVNNNSTAFTSNNSIYVEFKNAIGTNETAPDITTGGLCLNQGAEDSFIMTFKSSDVAHGMTDLGQTDTFAFFKKGSGTTGGLEMNCMSEDVIAAQLQGFAGAISTARNTDANATVGVRARYKSGTAWGVLGSNGNLFTVSNHNTCRFIFDSEGDFHADSSSTTFDEYDDAQLARTFDITHGRGVIESKFDKFISYNHEKLAELELVGREDDGTPNHFINVTGMQRLHNGAIWQQYEKHQKLAEAVYEMAKEALGEDKADAILEKHDIKLLN